MSDKTVITIWSKWIFNKKTKKGKFHFNHIEKNWDENILSPVPVSEWQKKMWEGCEWKKEKTYIVNGVIL